MELQFDPDAGRRRALCEEALALAREEGDERVLARVLFDYRMATQGTDALDLRTQLAEELKDLSEQLGDPELRYWAHWNLAVTAGETADFRAVDENLRLAGEIAEELGHPSLLRTWRIMVSARQRTAAELKAAEELAIEAAQPENPWVSAAQLGGLRWEQGACGRGDRGDPRAGTAGEASGFEAGAVMLLATSEPRMRRVASSIERPPKVFRPCPRTPAGW